MTYFVISSRFTDGILWGDSRPIYGGWRFVILQPSSPVIDDGISFWEGVIASKNDNYAKDEEHSNEMDLDIPMSQNISQLQLNGTTNADDANSSTDSTPDPYGVNNVVLSWENV